MKSLGDTLRAAREERDISVDQAVHETSISRNYLEALENEDFDEFPAEIYLVGFLRNYAEFLGLESDRIISRFRNYRLSEDPTPIQELVGKPKRHLIRRVLPWFIAALLLAAAAAFGLPRLLTVFENWKAARQERADRAELAASSREILPTPPLWEGEVRPTDVIFLEDGDGQIRLEVHSDEDKLRFDGGEIGDWSVLLGEEVYIPGADGRPSWRLYLKDFGLSGGGGVIELQLLPRAVQDEDPGISAASTVPPNSEAGRRREQRIILSATRPESYSLDIAFGGFCFIRYAADGSDPLESYYSDGDGLQLNVERRLTLWISDAGTMTARIGARELGFGNSGEVVVQQILWVHNEESGNYDLTAVPLY